MQANALSISPLLLSVVTVPSANPDSSNGSQSPSDLSNDTQSCCMTDCPPLPPLPTVSSASSLLPKTSNLSHSRGEIAITNPPLKINNHSLSNVATSVLTTTSSTTATFTTGASPTIVHHQLRGNHYGWGGGNGIGGGYGGGYGNGGGGGGPVTNPWGNSKNWSPPGSTSSDPSPPPSTAVPPTPSDQPTPPGTTTTPDTNIVPGPGSSGNASTGTITSTPTSTPGSVGASVSVSASMASTSSPSINSTPTSTMESTGAMPLTPSSSNTSTVTGVLGTGPVSTSTIVVVVATTVGLMVLILFCVTLRLFLVRRRNGSFQIPSISSIRPRTQTRGRTILRDHEVSSTDDPFRDPQPQNQMSSWSTDTLTVPFITDVQLIGGDLESTASISTANLVFARPAPASGSSSANPNYFSSTGHYDIVSSPQSSFERPESSDRTEVENVFNISNSPISPGARLRVLLDEARSS